MKLIISALMILTSIECVAQNQGVNNWWNLGYGSYWGAPWGHTRINFFSGGPVITSDSLEMDINRTSANISDSSGNLLFYTNGYYIADATGDTMLNGNNISPTSFYNFVPYGLTVTQACLILPYPDSTHLYYLFHSTLDNGPYYDRAHQLYVSLINMNLNGGLGGVVYKNSILLQDTLNNGKLTACKHANGRDWWLICQRANSNTFYTFLITPSMIFGPYVQNIGSVRLTNYGMANFSPDGKYYASFHAEYVTSGGLDVFEFDRCTGLLSNDLHINIPQTTSFSGGMSFSGNSQFLYVANIDRVYQFNILAANIAASQQTIAVWDTFYSPSPPFATLFDVMQLAPDGKIYISTGNGTFHMHVINQPDSVGLACDLDQHSIQFQYFYSNGFPNHPNYFLGCDTTSNCPCLISSLPEMINSITDIEASPNPNYGKFILKFKAREYPGKLNIYDAYGQAVHREPVSPWSQLKEVNIQHFDPGIYFCKLTWNDKTGIVKILVVK